jgi:polyisoprenoid-binding protein YceI
MSDTNTTSRIFKGRLIPLPGVYMLDPVHTFAEFMTQHLVVGHVRGRFDDLTGKVTLAEETTLSSLEVSIETASVSTHHAKRDEDLRSPRFFDVEKFPTMTYRSTAIVAELDGQWTVEGTLTIRDVSVHVPLSVRITGIIDDPMGNVRVGIHAHAQASRRDFGLLADLERESGGMLLGKDVDITVDAEALLQK